MSDLQRVLPYNNAFHDQLQDRLLFREARGVQACADPVTKRPHIGQDLVGLRRLAPELHLLFLLDQHCPPPLGEVVATLPQLLQADHLGLIGVEQPLLLTLQPFEARFQFVRRGLLLLPAHYGQFGEMFELRDEPRGVLEHGTHMLPYGSIQLLAFCPPLRTDRCARTQDPILPPALVIVARWLGGGCFVGRAVHRQATGLTRQ